MAGEKLAVKTADTIERRIVENRWPAETSLGSEAQLLEEFGVSRAVLREAVLLLEQRQIAVRRRGNGGGVMVRRPDPSSVARAVSLLLECDGVEAEQILEARILLEQRCVHQAIRNAKPSERRALTDHARAGLGLSGESARRQMGDFHLLLARLSGNPVWTMFTQVLIQVAADLVAHRGRQPSEASIHAQFGRLVKIATLIEQGEGDAAATALGDFIEDVTRRYIQPPGE